MIQQSKSEVVNTTITDNESVPGGKIATIEYTSKIKEISFENLTLPASNSNVKSIVAYYDEINKKYREATATKIISGSFDLYAYVDQEDKKAELIWDTGNMSAILNHFIEASLP